MAFAIHLRISRITINNNNVDLACQEKNGLPRVQFLKSIKASVRFLSMEALLEDLTAIDLMGIQWVIVGGESGPRARPMKQEWIENIKGQCDASNTSFFFKQWGAWGIDAKKRSKKANGRFLLGRTWDSMPGLYGPLPAVC